MKTQHDDQTTPRRASDFRPIFLAVVRHPRKVLVASLLAMLAGAVFLPSLVKDTRSDAFLPVGDPSLEARDRAREVFGLADPLVVAVVASEGRDVFTPETLSLVERLSDAIAALPGIDSARVTSLATESRIDATDEGMRIAPLFEEAPRTESGARAVREAVFDFPLYVGSLVSEAGRMTLIAAELDESFDSGETYAAAAALAEAADPRLGETLYVAGEGGVAGYLGDYIDADTRRMVPAALVAIALMLAIAHRSVHGVLLPLVVVIGGACVAVGAMAATGARYTLITPALPVILVAVGVADGIHILGQYRRELARDRECTQGELVVRTLAEVARPIAVTSITDAAGFLALAASTTMPPFRAFGVFAAVGVMAIFAFSVFTLPAALSLLPRADRRARRDQEEARHPIDDTDRPGPISSVLGGLANVVARHPRRIAGCAAALGLVGLASAGALVVDYERVRNFRADVPIRLADRAINRHMDGINHLDVMIEAEEEGGILEPAVLERIESFQRAVDALAEVGGSTSVVDHLKQLNRAFQGGADEHYRRPDTRAAAAQLLLLADMDGMDGAIHRTLDPAHRTTLVRIHLPTGRYRDEAVVVEAVERMLDRSFGDAGLETSLAGRVNVDYRWMRGVERAHFVSVGLALLAVCCVSALLFRSVSAGLITVAPVALAVGTIYAVMSSLGLWLGITTSMFAAIAIGLGVDFSVHLLERLRRDVRERGLSIDAAVAEALSSVGRELVFNFACAGLGFGVLSLSRVPTLVEFGQLTFTAVAASFVGGLVLLPVLVELFRPASIVGAEDATASRPVGWTRRPLWQVIDSRRCPTPTKTGRSSSNVSWTTTHWR